MDPLGEGTFVLSRAPKSSFGDLSSNNPAVSSVIFSFSLLSSQVEIMCVNDEHEKGCITQQDYEGSLAKL